jgi:hypothetical protein
MLVKRDLRKYEETHNIKLTFDSITIDFHNNLVNWYKLTRNLAPNSIGARIKVIKTVMRAAHDRGLHNNTDFQKKAFVKPNEETVAIYLSEDELMKLYGLDLTDNQSAQLFCYSIIYGVAIFRFFTINER